MLETEVSQDYRRVASCIQGEPMQMGRSKSFASDLSPALGENTFHDFWVIDSRDICYLKSLALKV